MDRQEVVLAGMASAGGVALTPVRVQKLFFLVDRRLSTELGGPFFDFQPYHYGPFDREVYRVLEILAEKALVAIEHRGGSMSTYALTRDGVISAERVIATLDSRVKTYLHELANFVRSLSFAQLVSAIYSEYPEMRVNSVFRGAM